MLGNVVEFVPENFFFFLFLYSGNRWSVRRAAVRFYVVRTRRIARSSRKLLRLDSSYAPTRAIELAWMSCGDDALCGAFFFGMWSPVVGAFGFLEAGALVL